MLYLFFMDGFSHPKRQSPQINTALGVTSTKGRGIRFPSTTTKSTEVNSGSPWRLHEIQNLGKEKHARILPFYATLKCFGLQPEGHTNENHCPSFDPSNRLRAVGLRPHDISAMLQRRR
jgi:hypothetical protein